MPSDASESVTLCATVKAVTIFTTLISAGVKSSIARQPPSWRTSTAGSRRATRNITWSRPIQM